MSENLRQNVRNFLMLATIDELERELKISTERSDMLRARYVQELIDEAHAEEQRRDEKRGLYSVVDDAN